jgi:hypothetical protein
VKMTESGLFKHPLSTSKTETSFKESLLQLGRLHAVSKTDWRSGKEGNANPGNPKEG